MNRFPARTVILMALALASFVWFWWRTHQAPAQVVPVILLMDGGVP